MLASRCLADLRQHYEALTFALPDSQVHGDAHCANLLRAPDGQVLLLDFERFAVGPREWDLTEAGLEHYRLGRVNGEDYRRFVQNYGFDPTASPSFDALCDIRELTMTTWLTENLNKSREVAEEFAVRIGTIRDRRDLPLW